MAMRRPRVKATANLSIRRNPKVASASVPVAAPKTATVEPEPVPTKWEPPEYDGECKTPPALEQEFKLPNPVDDGAKISTEEPAKRTTGEPCTYYTPSGNSDDATIPKKPDIRPAFALPSARKRIRTESTASSKSITESIVAIGAKARKATKQEAAQRPLPPDNRKEARKRLNNIQNVDKQSLTVFDMIYYNPARNPMTAPSLSKRPSLENIPGAVGDRNSRSRSVSKSRSPTPAPVPATNPLPVASVPTKPTLQLTPQLKLGPNGEMILDEASLVIENERERAFRETLANGEVVYDDEFSGNTGYYSRYKRTKEWSNEETVRFYRSLHTIGTDFSMMRQLFPGRDRRDLKLKFKKEERLNLSLVNKALMHPKMFNIEELKQQFRDEDEELLKQKNEREQRAKELTEKYMQEKLAKKTMLMQLKNRNPRKRISKAERVMANSTLLEQTADALSKVMPQAKKPSKRSKKRPEEQDRECTEVNLRLEELQQEEERIYGPSNTRTEDNFILLHDVVRLGDSEAQEEDETKERLVTLEGTVDSHRDAQPTLVADYDQRYNVNKSDGDRAEAVDGGGGGETEVITIQNLDDHSRTTVACPRTDPMAVAESTTVLNRTVEHPETLPTFDFTFDANAGLVYIPVPTNAPIATHVKTEIFVNAANGGKSCPDRDIVDCVPPPVSEFGTPSQDLACGSISPPSAVPEPEPELDPSIPLSNIKSEIACLVNKSEPEPSEAAGGDEIEIDKQEDHQDDEEEAIEVDEKYSPRSPVVCHTDAVPTNVGCEAGALLDDGEDDEMDGLNGLLGDIDLNSLVLVESQDANDPEKTIYEIYVTSPETGLPGEKPLDVPPDMIENIRAILEANEDC